jgi:L-lactate dehydrogenase complex protein LldF
VKQCFPVVVVLHSLAKFVTDEANVVAFLQEQRLSRRLLHSKAVECDTNCCDSQAPRASLRPFAIIHRGSHLDVKRWGANAVWHYTIVFREVRIKGPANTTHVECLFYSIFSQFPKPLPVGDAMSLSEPTMAKTQLDPSTTSDGNGHGVHRNHATLANAFVADEKRTHWHDGALWFVRQKRDRMVAAIPEWETLRKTAAQIKAHTLARLPEYLEEFERNATALGAVVHWACDAEEHNRIVHGILAANNVKRVVKSKSMLTEECHLNPYLEERGMEIVDTDLGEWIVQLRGETPSHIVLPAIHIKKEEVGETFHKHIGTPKGNADPMFLTRAARGELRQRFVGAQAGITGVNFAIAETGGFVVCTNEGNADLGVSLPPIHIACMGIEKFLPRLNDLAVFTRLLARSATGQPITTYTSHFHGPRPGGQLHIVLVDNGRTDLRASPTYRESLQCIRCGACMNTCPVYRRSGGHSYSNTVPGPIGSVLAPAMDAKKHHSLPYACTLCGSCTDVCPVKIPLHHQLLAWRGELAERKLIPLSKRLSMKMGRVVLGTPWIYMTAGWIARKSLRILPKWLTHNYLNTWARQRDLPEAPKDSFRKTYKRLKNKE